MPIAYIGLGANLPSPAGSPEATMAAAAKRLVFLGRVNACSSLYFTAPVGFADQPHFFNAVVALDTDLSPRQLLDALLEIEREFGRDRSARIENGPRTLDLDIILFGDLAINEYNLAIPHPRLAERGFVVVPLAEIAAQARDPRTGATVAQYLEKLFPDPEGANDAVVRVESDLWRAGACGAGSPLGAARANSGDGRADG